MEGGRGGVRDFGRGRAKGASIGFGVAMTKCMTIYMFSLRQRKGERGERWRLCQSSGGGLSAIWNYVSKSGSF